MDLSTHRIEEIYQFAAMIEQGGFDFYEKLIAACDNVRVKNELKFLRDEEAHHKAFFQGELRKKAKAEVALGPGLAAVMAAEFVAPMDEFYKAGKITKIAEALRFGQVVEQKTIDFYSDLRGQSKDAGFLKDLDAIIEEEKKHKQKLTLILAY